MLRRIVVSILGGLLLRMACNWIGSESPLYVVIAACFIPHIYSIFAMLYYSVSEKLPDRAITLGRVGANLSVELMCCTCIAALLGR